MASKSKLSQIFENSSKNLFDTMRYNWGIGYSEGEEVPRRNEGNVEIDLPPSKKSSKKSDRIKKIREAVSEAAGQPGSLYNA